MAYEDMDHNRDNTMPVGNEEGGVDDSMNNTEGRPDSAEDSAFAADDNGNEDRGAGFGERIDEGSEAGGGPAPDTESARMNRDEQDDTLSSTGNYNTDTGEMNTAPGSDTGRDETFGERIGAPAANSGGPTNATEKEDSDDDRSLTERIRDKMNDLTRDDEENNR